MTRAIEESAKEWLVGAGWAYLAFAWFAFLVGLGFSIREHGVGHALAQIDPTNLRSWAVTAIVFAPGEALVVWGYRLGEGVKKA